jgi:hypothetical protein
MLFFFFSEMFVKRHISCSNGNNIEMKKMKVSIMVFFFISKQKLDSNKIYLFHFQGTNTPMADTQRTLMLFLFQLRKCLLNIIFMSDNDIESKEYESLDIYFEAKRTCLY